MKYPSWKNSFLAVRDAWTGMVLLGAVTLVAGVLPARGQSPFETGAVAAGDPDREEAAGEQEDSALAELIAAEQDALVLAIVRSRPTTPTQWIDDVRALVNLRRYELAREYLKQFSGALPDEQVLADLQAEYGSDLFLRLSNLPELQPEGASVSDAILRAASERLRDWARLAALVEDLTGTDESRQRAALLELVKSGSAAAPALIRALPAANDAGDQRAIRTALVALGDEAHEPLIAALDSGNETVRRQAIETLAELQAVQAVPFVLHTALSETADPLADAARQLLRDVLGTTPGKAEAKQYLGQKLQEFLAGSLPGPVDEQDQVTLWIWDAEQQTPRQQDFPAADASFLAAAMMAEQRYRLDTTDEQSLRMYLATGLEMTKRVYGYARPLTAEMGSVYQDAQAADTGTLQAVLALAQEQNLPGAAIAAIELLSGAGDTQLLATDDGKPSLLAQALVSPDTRVKVAAARAIMQLNPTVTYPGSSYLPEVLGYLSASGGRRRVLIGHPRRDDALQLAGYLQVLGFEVDSCQQGREVMLQAVSNPDYSFLLLHDAIDRPPYRELVQMLRHDQRTGKLPVGLLVREENAETARWFARTDALTLDLAPPQTQADVAVDARRLLALSGRAVLTQDEKLDHANFALAALRQLASARETYSFYDLLSLDQRLEATLAVPQLAARAAEVLGLLGTPRAQRALVDLANSHARSLADRQAAVAAFRTAVSRRGILLTRDQLLRQYDLYNASQFMDRDTQAVLAGILDALEAPTHSRRPADDQD